MVRWYAHKLQNNSESRVAQLKKIEAMAEDGTFEVLPKKEVMSLKKQQEKLEKNLGGIKEMQDIPRHDLRSRPKKRKNLYSGSTYSGYSFSWYL